MASCEKHPFEGASAMCGRCAYHYCQDCLVFAKGSAKTPYCIACALVMAGVKTSGGPAPRLNRRALKAELRTQRAAQKAAAKGGGSDGPGRPPVGPGGHSFPDLDWAAMEAAEAAFRAGPGATSPIG